MKYMTFNSSCSYAGVANMLEQYGFDTDDRTIALGMKLPFLFSKEDDAYLAGPMLQSSKWFNLYLNPIGFNMVETWVEREEVLSFLRDQKTAMLGIRVSPGSKHAVVYLGVENGKYVLLNNKWQHTDEPDQLVLSEAELLERLDERCVIATLHPVQRQEVDFSSLLEESVRVLGDLKRGIEVFCREERSPKAVMDALNTLFRAILLDGITMLELSGKENLADKLRSVQTELMAAVRKGSAMKLWDEISITALLEVIDEYAEWIAGNIG